MRPAFAIAAVLAALTLALPTGLDSCGISDPSHLFATRRRPADIWGQFARGRIGVLPRSYEPKYFIAAFRILSGVPLTQEEAETLLIDPPRAPQNYARTSLDDWLAARQKVRPLPEIQRLETYKTVNLKGLQYSFQNCQANAFATAAQNLAALVKLWSLDDPRLLEWTTAQDQVFANCAAAAPVLPAPPGDGMDPALAAHRRYQIAAALFYAGEFRRAAQSFDAIAREQDSPWQEIAPYLTARALLRAGLIDGNREAFAEGSRRIQAILADPAQASWHKPSHELLEVWRLRAEPELRMAELSNALTTPGKVNIRQEVTDLLYLTGNNPELAESESAGEMAAWVVAMSPYSGAAAKVSAAWWRRKQNATWLIPALSLAKAEDAPELLQAAAKVLPSSPAYESVSYYAARLAKRTGERDQARRFADRALARNLTRSSRNLILTERLELSRNWDEFLRFSLRRIEPQVAEYDGNEIDMEDAFAARLLMPMFDSDAVHVLNRHVPLTLWMDASRNQTLPAHLQSRIALTGWVRAVLLNKPAEAAALMRRVVELQPAAAEQAKNYLDARDPAEARFATVYLSLWAPPMCLFLSEYEFIRGAQFPMSSPRSPSASRNTGGAGCWSWSSDSDSNNQAPHAHDTDFLTAEQRGTGEEEAKQLALAPPWTATYLLQESIAWAKGHPDDPRVPQALHMAVAGSRNSMGGDTGKFSKQAFDLLHRRYPKSEWTARTRYWYK